MKSAQVMRPVPQDKSSLDFISQDALKGLPNNLGWHFLLSKHPLLTFLAIARAIPETRDLLNESH